MSQKVIADVVERDETVYFIRIEKGSLAQFCAPLLKYVLYPDSKFFSYTERGGVISLIVDEEALALFKTLAPEDRKGIEYHEKPWKVVQLDYGSCPHAMDIGIISLAATLLAQKNIPVYYLSTFDRDFIMAPSEMFADAVAWLKKNLEGSGCTLAHNALESVNLKIDDDNDHKELISLPDELSLASLRANSDRNSSTLQKLLKLIFFENTSSKFLSFNRVDSEFTFLLERSHYDFLAGSNLNSAGLWKAIQRKVKANFYETGVVAVISHPLSQAKINCMYLSTFQTSYIIVPQESFADAITALGAAGFSM
eukprot:TRINITY_DN4505_c0_g1_i1.p1 TRINITY_DN4505_c0_g1~~TRINITY_DN4505_c0_g1_i1.p1  ORF type:complete len:310 (-),score=36.84 TRINITY_DN4505_c0_g1_i1:129-1058(-)